MTGYRALVVASVAFIAAFFEQVSFAQEILDVTALEAKVQQACPERWEPLTAGIEIQGTPDPWRGDDSDRQVFLDYLADIEDETQTTADVEAMKNDVVTVITECAANKTALYAALRAQTEDQVSDYTIGDAPEEDDEPVPTGTALELAADSCRAIQLGHPESSSGLYWIQSITAETPEPIQVYCDMDSDDGGWTLIVAQFEADPVTDWNEGLQQDYDPGLSSGASFAMQRYDIPPHVETAFGRGTQATFVDYVRFVYDTGDIPVMELTGKKSGERFNLYRNSSAYHEDYDPESQELSDSEGNNALTFDKTNGVDHSWTFAPNQADTGTRGYAMAGDVSGSDESYAWTVWVR